MGKPGRWSARLVLLGVGAAALAVGAAVACSGGRSSSDHSSAGEPTASAAPSGSAGELPVEESNVPAQPDPDALEELLAAAPTSRPAQTGPDGGTLVGSATGKKGDAGAEPEPSGLEEVDAGRAVLEAGKVMVQPGLSNVAIEHALRAQVYWRLVQKCRGPEGELLPPDTVTLVFTVRSDGTVDPASVGATANERRYDKAAECVVREFSAIPFRGPPASIGGDSRVISTLPSVD
jgi:hypothetical protein